jgi:nucleotide-binding universal stress UspA family protein
MTQRYVVGVDGSEGGRRALRWAIGEAMLRPGLVHAVHAWLVPPSLSLASPFTTTAVDSGELEQWAKNSLATDVSRVATEAGAGESMITAELVRGQAPEVLLTRAAYADLLVVGNRGRGGFKGLLLGSVSQHCAAHAPVPVAVVRPTSPLPDRSDIVVGVDGSSGSLAALDFAVREAVARDARLVVAHAWWTAYPSSTTDILPFISVDRGVYIGQSRDLMREMLGRVTTTERQPRAVQLVPVEDAPAQGLLSLSENAGLLVVGSRGRGGLTGMLLGSVSQQCLHHAQCAVVVVPETQAHEGGTP